MCKERTPTDLPKAEWQHRALESLDQRRLHSMLITTAWGRSFWWSSFLILQIRISCLLLFTVNQETELPAEHFVSSLSVLKLFTFSFVKRKYHLQTHSKKRHNKTFLKQSSWYQNLTCETLTVSYWIGGYIIALGIAVYKNPWNKDCILTGCLWY